MKTRITKHDKVAKEEILRREGNYMGVVYRLEK